MAGDPSSIIDLVREVPEKEIDEPSSTIIQRSMRSQELLPMYILKGKYLILRLEEW